MNKYKFNPYERAVGFFICFAMTGSFFIGLGLAVKKNWFEEKLVFATYTHSAANLREGSTVLLSGLKVGKVEKIELDPEMKIKVSFTILKEFGHLMTEGMRVQFIRPYIIGDKSLTLIPGNSRGRLLAQGESLPLMPTLDLMEVANGEKLETMVAKVEGILDNLNDITVQVGEKKKIKRTIDDLNFTLAEVRKVMPHLTANVPATSQHLAKTIENLSGLTSSIKTLQPEGAKTIELLNESLITLKAMQKSFFMKGNVEEVKKEMQERVPASQ